MEVLGRVLIHFSPEPVSFLLGVTALWVHKQLQGTGIGHMALHGVYDNLAGGEAFAADTFSWDTPIDEEAWRYGHNVRHHNYTNVAGKDPDIRFGPVRLTDQTPHRPEHRFGLPFTFGLTIPNFGFFMNLHFTGILDAYGFNSLPEDKLDFLPDRSAKSVRGAWRKALRKHVPYYLKNYVFFPALAGPLFWKVLLGNWMAEVLRDVYSAATIYCGHVNDGVRTFPEGWKARDRGEWYAMQVESTSNFEVGAPWSILCGGLERQIEHHLFPRLPSPRLSEIAPEVRAICARHGVEYKTSRWAAALRASFLTSERSPATKARAACSARWRRVGRRPRRRPFVP